MNQTTVVFAFACVLRIIVPSALAADAIDIAGNRQVFIDGRFFQDAKGVNLVVHAPAKTGERSIEADQAWEDGIGSYASVLKDGETYHLWYKSNKAVCYARSKDGIRWEKPALGLVDCKGNRDNNMVIGYGAGGAEDGGHGPQVFIDPTAPADQRFRLITRQADPGYFVDMFSSPDGIHWTLTHKDILKYHPLEKPFHLDSQNVIFRDDRIGKYVAYMRRNIRTESSQGRSIVRSESETLDGFQEAQDAAVVITHDDKDLKLGGINMVDYYTSSAIKYPYAQDAYYMFPAVYLHYVAGRQSEWPDQAPINSGPLHTRFAASRDGVQWEQYDRRPFISLGMKDEFDRLAARGFYGLVPSVDGRSLYMYYLGSDKIHGWGRDDKNNNMLAKAGLAPSGTKSAISRVVLRMDGFVSACFDYTGGEFTTQPLKFAGNRLVLNLDTSATGIGRVGILDASGKAIEGFAAADCDLIHTCNDINRAVSWKGNADLSKLAGHPVRLRFVMRDCDLYAFGFGSQRSAISSQPER